MKMENEVELMDGPMRMKRNLLQGYNGVMFLLSMLLPFIIARSLFFVAAFGMLVSWLGIYALHKRRPILIELFAWITVYVTVGSILLLSIDSNFEIILTIVIQIALGIPVAWFSFKLAEHYEQSA